MEVVQPVPLREMPGNGDRKVGPSRQSFGLQEQVTAKCWCA